MTSQYEETGRQRGRRRKKNRGALKLLLLLFVAAIICGVYKMGGLSSIRLPARADTGNIQTDFDVDLEKLANLASGGDFSASQEDIDDLNKTADKNPEYKEKIQFFIDHISAYDQTAVNSILLSPEKTDFVLLAPFTDETPAGSWDISVQKGHVPYFVQYDSRWAFHGYGSSCMGNTACGPTCLAMAAAGLTGDAKYTPDYVADYAENNGYYISGSGTAWSLYTDGASGLGIKGEAIAADKDTMRSCLKDGGVLIVSVNPGDFTMAGHFIVIYDCGATGFKVYDPSSIARSGQSWSYSALAPQIAQVWCMSTL